MLSAKPAPLTPTVGARNFVSTPVTPDHRLLPKRSSQHVLEWIGRAVFALVVLALIYTAFTTSIVLGVLVLLLLFAVMGALLSPRFG